MRNQFVDEPPLCSTLPRVRVCDPFYVAADAFEPSCGDRLVCVENVVGESVLFCFDRVAALAPSVSVMLEQIHRLVANDASIAPDALRYEFCTVNWLKIGPTFLPVSFDGSHLRDCGPWCEIWKPSRRRHFSVSGVRTLRAPARSPCTAEGCFRPRNTEQCGGQ